MLGEVTQSMRGTGHSRFLSKREQTRRADNFALVVTGAIASVMLLSNYSQSIAGMFTLLSVIGQREFAVLLRLLARVVIGARRFPAFRHGGRHSHCGSVGAALFCLWATIGIGSSRSGGVALVAAGIPVYGICRYQARGAPSIAKSAPVTHVDSSEASKPPRRNVFRHPHAPQHEFCLHGANIRHVDEVARLVGQDEDRGYRVAANTVLAPSMAICFVMAMTPALRL